MRVGLLLLPLQEQMKMQTDDTKNSVQAAFLKSFLLNSFLTF
jgi:hypothetical protein